MTITIFVLSGLHQGAEIHIAPSSSGDIPVALGSDAFNTDITLLDPGILPVHCRFSADKNGFRLCENNSSEPLQQGSYTILPGDYIACGKPFICAGTALNVKYRTTVPFSRRKMIFIPAGAIAMIAAGWFTADHIIPPALSVAKILSEEPYRCLSQEIKNTQLIIRGFINTEAKKTLINYLRHQDIAYQLDVVTPDYEMKKLNTRLISLPNNHLTAVLSQTCGHIDIQGIRAPHQYNIPLIDYLSDMVLPEEISINDRSTISDDYIKNIDSQINTVDPESDIISYTFSENAITLISDRKADDALIKKLSVIIDNFNERFRFSYQTNIIVQPESKPVIRINAVSLGNIPYIITDKGKKYRAGAAPDKDTRIISIDKEKMVLLYKNKYYTITYTDDKKQ